MKPERASIINYRKLRAQRAYLGLYIEDIAKSTGSSTATVCAFLQGREGLNLQTIISLAAALGLRPVIDFEPLEPKDESAPQNQAA